MLHFVCAEELVEGTGTGDFDARLVVQSDPQHVGESFLVGGVPDITIGKMPDKHIILNGKLVSRFHCKLVRLDFGPSRWELQDNNSTNGLFINGERVSQQELHAGDVIRVGEYELTYVSTYERDQQAAQAAANAAALAAGGALCPSCGMALPAGAKICIDCGVDVTTGRSLIVSKGFDEEAFESTAHSWIRGVSWIIPFGLFPIASEAFGTKKPLSTWVIFGITVLASTLFVIAAHSQGEDLSPSALNLLQWNGSLHASMLKENPQLAALMTEAANDGAEPQLPVGFRWYQPFTCALLHDPDLIMPFISHLSGNMLFLLVFGLRVNELVDNWRFAILYPLLAVGSGLIDPLMTMNEPLYPSLGASGAIMGLAGAYFVFFPAQRVHVAIWFRGGMITKWQCFYKVFTMRGFWLLVLWIGANDLLPTFIGLRDNVSHWAHLGGFIVGVVLASVLLISRQVRAFGGDLLSVVLGKRAWALVGKPAARATAG